jgi:hypothetical protein
MNYGSPLTKDHRVKKPVEEKEVIKKPKVDKIPKSVCRQLVLKPCEEHHCRWIERYMNNLIDSNCFPPKLRTKEAFSALSEYFTPSDALKILEDIRHEFSAHFAHEEPKGEFDFLVAVVNGDPSFLH